MKKPQGEGWEKISRTWYGPPGSCTEMIDTRHSIRPGYQCICGVTWAEVTHKVSDREKILAMIEGRITTLDACIKANERDEQETAKKLHTAVRSELIVVRAIIRVMD